MNKTIWMCWFQGEDHESLSGLNRKCINRWKELNPTWEVNVLSDKTIADYVPEYFDIVKNSPKRNIQARADLLRILLLSKFGGVWADVSVFPMESLSRFYHKVLNETGFFTYRFIPRGGYGTDSLETVVWFLCTKEPNHYLIDEWKHSYIENFINLQSWRYFTFGETLTTLYDSNKKIKSIIDGMVQINEKIPHSALKLGWGNKKPSYLYKRPNFTE
jgi:hypothetical protein